MKKNSQNNIGGFRMGSDKRRGVHVFGIRPRRSLTEAPSDVSDIFVELADWKSGCNITYHFSHNALVYVYKGRCDITVNEKTYSLGSDSLLFLKGGTEWHYRLDGEELCTILSVNFLGSFCDAILRTYRLESDVFFRKSGCRALADRLQQFCNREDVSDTEIQHEVLIFLLRTAQHLAAERDGAITVSTLAERILNYCQKYAYSPELRIENIARTFNRRPQDLQRLFKKEYDTTIHKFIAARRIGRAAELLTESDMPLSDIAAAVGYADRRYLDHLFQKHYHMTPSEYRRLNRLKK